MDIIFIDDDATLRRALVRIFQDAGFSAQSLDPVPHCFSLSDAFEGVVPPRVLVSDFDMGLVTALNTVEVVRTLPGWEKTQIVVLTGGMLSAARRSFMSDACIPVLSKGKMGASIERLKGMLTTHEPG